MTVFVGTVLAARRCGTDALGPTPE